MHLDHHRRGSGEPLVLIHGIGSQWQIWLPVLDRLARERDVIAIDLPGFGGSPPPPLEPPPAPEELARHVAGFLDELEIEAPHVGGNSLGGWVALELAKAGRARSVTALAPAGLWRERGPRWLDVNLRLSRAGAHLPDALARPLLRTVPGRALMTGHMVARPGRLPPEAALEALHGLAAAPGFHPVRKAANAARFTGGREIRVPVTIAFPQHDRVLTRRQAQRPDELPPQARVVELRGCGHVPTYDDPEQVASVLLEGSSQR